MLSKVKMVKVRKTLESLYDGKCTITEYQKIKKENKSTGFQEVPVHEGVPCRLSFTTMKKTNQSGVGASTVVQTTKVFLSPDIQVKPGSKLTITQNNITTEYKSSGEPAFYSTHQEIVLELFKEWA